MNRLAAGVLRPLIFEVLSAVPLSTTEIRDRIVDRLYDSGARRSIGGVRLAVPVDRPCRDCGHAHRCSEELPVSTTLLKPHLDALARSGAVIKHSRGQARPALWTLADLHVPDTVDGLADGGGVL